MTASVRLRRGRAKPVWAGHPAVLSGAVESVEGGPAAGDVVLVMDHDGKPIGRGLFAPASEVRVRMLSRDPAEEIDREFFVRRIRRAVALRCRLRLPREGTTAFRLLHGDGDGLPGVVADRFGDFGVLQLTVRGMEDRRSLIAEALVAETGLRGILLRRVPALEAPEGLAGAEGDLGPAPVPAGIEVEENGVRFTVAPAEGQKTGHFLDHRENRALVAGFAEGRSVLDAFTGTGGFALAAARAGAREALAIDSSPAALDAARGNAEANGVADRIRFEKADVFRALRGLESEGRSFDLIVLDPPRMAARRKELGGALRGYKELNLRAMRLLAPDGILATASCTGVVSEDEFERTLRDAALDAGRGFSVIFRRGQGPDHPFSIAAPEGRYLKFLVLQRS